MKTIEEKDDVYIKGYEKTLEEVKVAEVSAKLASKILKKENWSQYFQISNIPENQL